MKIRNWIVVAAVFFAGVLILRPVPIPDDEKDCLRVSGTVRAIYEAGVKDVVFKLKGVDRAFYINRGLERGLDVKKLKADLMNKEVVMLYPKYWTPLDPFNSVRHISKLEWNGQTVFTEVGDQ